MLATSPSHLSAVMLAVLPIAIAGSSAGRSTPSVVQRRVEVEPTTHMAHRSVERATLVAGWKATESGGMEVFVVRQTPTSVTTDRHVVRNLVGVTWADHRTFHAVELSHHAHYVHRWVDGHHDGQTHLLEADPGELVEPSAGRVLPAPHVRAAP